MGGGLLVLLALVTVNPGVAVAQDPTDPAGGGDGPGGVATTTVPTTRPPVTTTTVAGPGAGAGTDQPGPTTTVSTEAPDTATDDFRDPGDATIPPRRRDQLVPPPIDLTSLNQLLATKRAEAVDAARELADAANADAMAVAVDAKSTLDGLQAQVPALDRSVTTARSAERRASVALERARSRKADLAVESYTRALSGRSATMDASFDLLESSQNYERFVRTTEYSGAAWSSLDRGVSSAERSLEQAEAATQAAIDARQRLERRIGSAQSDLDSSVASAQTVAVRGEEAIAVAAATGADLAVEGLGPTILGETLLTPEDLAEFSARRSGAGASVDLLELARLFVLEGTAEGVRGDIAWAQSILETGNFGYKGSMVSTSDHNYAGIGACDSCASGFRYETPQLGVRAQMQLLHTYADDNLTTDRLAFPPVGRSPERSHVRGCCDTWMELSGVWATGPGYGVKILTIYNEMLAFAAQRQRDAAAFAALAAPAGESPVPAAPAAPAPDAQPGG